LELPDAPIQQDKKLEQEEPFFLLEIFSARAPPQS